VPPAALARRVAPLSVQLLVENALKHNEASRQHPLHLSLRVLEHDPDFLLVENNLRPRTAGLVSSTGTGLANVRQRYHLLDPARPLEIRTQDGAFSVKLPLLDGKSFNNYHSSYKKRMACLASHCIPIQKHG
jgi:LytS/YehU family sensor histidine kinase